MSISGNIDFWICFSEMATCVSVCSGAFPTFEGSNVRIQSETSRLSAS